MNKIIAFVFIIALAGAGYYLYINRDGTGADIGEVSQDLSMLTYSSTEYGVSFQYPDTYVIAERDEPGSSMRRAHTVTLMDRDDAANIPEGGEGPVAITVQFFQNDIDDQTIENWIKNSSNSNYKLAINETLRPGTVDGVATLGYTWDGLYRGDSIVFEHKDNIVMMSVTYMSPEDKIRTDFTQLLASVDLK